MRLLHSQASCGQGKGERNPDQAQQSLLSGPHPTPCPTEPWSQQLLILATLSWKGVPVLSEEVAPCPWEGTGPGICTTRGQPLNSTVAAGPPGSVFASLTTFLLCWQGFFTTTGLG